MKSRPLVTDSPAKAHWPGARRGRGWATAGAMLPTAALLLVLGADFAGDVRGRDFHSWIDPRMYYLAAQEIRAGQVPPPSLMVPTVFPYAVAPLAGSISSALWVNFVLMGVLAAAVHALRQPLGIRAPAWVVAGVVLATPLVTGLSRTLYCELLLTAALAWLYAVWLRCGDFRRARSLWGFAAALALCLASKNTAVVFVAGAWAAWAMTARPSRAAGTLRRLMLTTASGVALAGVVQFSLLQSSLAYYGHWGGSDTSALGLIGPGRRWSVAALLYYPVQFVRSGLMGTAVFLPIALLTLRQADEPRKGHATMLGLWLLTPLAALSLVPMKEPRHILPCVVPAVLLIFMGLSRISSHGVRRGLTAAVAIAAGAQYMLIRQHVITAPYFVDRPMGFSAIADALHPMPCPPEARTAADQENFREYTLQHWAYSTNFALAGFEAGEAADLGWLLSPGAVYDLDRLPEKAGSDGGAAYARFEDLYSYTHLSQYNWRNGWRQPYFTLSREQIVDNANYLLLRGYTPTEAAAGFPRHRLQARVDTPRGPLLVLGAAGPVTPYRWLYAREFLARHAARGKPLSQGELDTICYEMFKTIFLQQRIPAPEELLAYFPPDYRPGRNLRPIYWFGSHILRSQPYLDRAYERFLQAASEAPSRALPPKPSPAR